MFSLCSYQGRDLRKPHNGNSWVLHLNEHVCQRSRGGFGFRFTTIVHGSFMLSFKKALSPWNFKFRGDKRLIACRRPVLKFWSSALILLSHWRPVNRNFGPCRKGCPVPCTALLFGNHGFDKLATQAKACVGSMNRSRNLTPFNQP